MAEYAGLEIRIGGNTTKLTNALKAPTKSAAELQSRIRQVTRAMQFDPTDLKNVATRIKITGDRMQSLQSKVQITREAMRQLGDTMVRVGDSERSVRDIANETQNLSLAAKQADERFNRLTGSLGQIYEAWNSLSREEGADFLTSTMNLSQAEADRLMKSTTSLREFKNQLKEIQEIRSSPLSDSGGPISDADIARAVEFKKLNFHDMFKRGTELSDMLKQAENLGITIEDSAVKSVRDLQKAFNEAQREKKGFDEALRYEQMGTDLQRIESEAESLSQTMRRLDDSMSETSRTPWFQQLEDDLRRVDAAIDNVETDMQRTKAAMDADPGNVQLAARYFNDLQQKATLTKEKVELLSAELDQLDASGAKQAAADHQDLAKWVEDSAEAARTAQKEYREQSAAVQNLEGQVKSLKQAIAMAEGDELLAGYSDSVVRWKKRTQELADEMKKLADREQEVAVQQRALETAQTTFDDEQAEVKKLKEQLEEARREYERLDAAFNDALGNGNFDGALNARLEELETEIKEIEDAYGSARARAAKFNSDLEMQAERVELAQSVLERQRGTVDDLRQSVEQLEGTPEVKLFKNPGEEIDEAKHALEGLEGELDQARAKEDELESAYSSARTENELAKTAQEARDVSQELDGAKASAHELDEELHARGGGLLNPSTIKSLGMTLSATITPALMGVGYSMMDASATVDSAYRDMRKTVEGTEEQFQHLRDAAIEFSRTHVTSADQILQIEAIGGELGVATDSLQTFAEVISNIDVATNLDTESAATALGHLSNILHLTEEDYVGFSDALVRLGNNGASTETEIANIAERIGSMGSIVGMSGSDILAWSSSIASTGQRAEAAGTAISRTMSFFETAVAAAGGSIDASFDSINAAVQEGGDKLTVFASLSGKTAEEFAEEWETNSKDMAKELKDQLDGAKEGMQMIADVAHMSSDEFIKAWENDPTSVMKAFIEGLNDIERSGGSADKVLQDLGIKSVRQKQAIEGLMQTIGGLDDNLLMSEHAWNGVSDKWGKAGDAANEASKKAEGFSGQLQIMKNMWQNFLAELGEGAAPWMQSISGVLGTMSKWFSSLSVDTKKWIVAIGGLATAAGPIMSLTGSLLTARGEIVNWTNTVISGTSIVRNTLVREGEEAANALMAGMTNMQRFGYVAGEMGRAVVRGFAFGAAIAGIGMLIIELKKLYDNYQTHITATSGLSNALADVGKASDITSDGIGSMRASFREAMEDSRGYESRLADLTKTLEDSNKQYGTYAGQLDYYSETISTLGGKSDKSAEETQKLEAALSAVNDACNTTYRLDEYGNIIDTETGKVIENTDAILANIDARRAQALLDYYSDDYAKAVGEFTDAQDKLNELTKEYNDLASDQGKQDYLNRAKEVEGAYYDEEKALSAYEYKLNNAKTAMDNYQAEVDKTGDVVRRLEGKMADAEEQMRKANQVVEDAAKAQEELDKRSDTVANDVTGNMKKLSDAATKVGTDDAGFNAIAESLDAIHVYAKELDNVDMSALASAFESTGGTMSDVIKTLEDGGVVMSTWNSALEQAPGAAENMSSLTTAAFQSMYEAANGDLNATMTLIAGLDQVQVEDKTFYIGDNGSITDAEGEVYDIKTDLATIPNEVITAYYLNDEDAMKKAMDAKAKIDDIGKQKPTPKVSIKDNATPSAKTLTTKLNNLNAMKPRPTASLNDKVTDNVNSIRANLRNLDGNRATVTITTVEKKVKQATGGYNTRPVIPRHATGYIATGPTLTNQGWIGEDGIEAVANWATGGAVVPLTNKKYMLPIADAIADGMSRRFGNDTPTQPISIYINGVSNPNEVADAVARRLELLGL